MLNALAATDPITTEWLTEALRVAGALPSGAVVACETRANAAFNSAACHLTLTYSADAPSDAPRQLFLKRNLEVDWAVEAGRDEVAFYKAMAPRYDQLPMLIHCYAALVDETRSASTLLMADVATTHTAPLLRDDQISESARGIPAPAALDQAIDALAAFHAAWLERPELGVQFEVNSWYSDADAFAAQVEERRADWTRFIASEGAWFPADL
ncbi:MAG TPA: hypothetical protein VIC27_09395, partial [Ktedonobacterales bacterium]